MFVVRYAAQWTFGRLTPLRFRCEADVRAGNISVNAPHPPRHKLVVLWIGGSFGISRSYTNRLPLITIRCLSLFRHNLQISP